MFSKISYLNSIYATENCTLYSFVFNPKQAKSKASPWWHSLDDKAFNIYSILLKYLITFHLITGVFFFTTKVSRHFEEDSVDIKTHLHTLIPPPQIDKNVIVDVSEIGEVRYGLTMNILDK